MPVRLGARYPQAPVQLVDQQAAARRVGLEPLAIDHQLRNGALAHTAHYLRGRGGICVDIDFGVRNAMSVKKLLGGAAITAPGSGVNLHVHRGMILKLRCYDL